MTETATPTELTEGDVPTTDTAPVRSFAEVAETVLTEAIRLATGNPDAEPREGQAILFDDITATLRTHGRVVCEAPTGSGKSFAALAPVMTAAAMFGERTVISTESLSLQDQLLHKDAPTVAAACEQTTGVAPKVALQKGWSNYACLVKAADVTKQGVLPSLTPATGDDKQSNLAALLAWIEEQKNSMGSGEKSEFPHHMTSEDWAKVSLSSEECIGTKCPLREVCFPARARERSQQADIVITNHATLGVQAAHGIPVIMGRREELRPFTHIVVDEAHGLPSSVRNAGASELSMPRLMRASKLLSGWLGSGHEIPDALAAAMDAAFGQLQRTLSDRDTCPNGFVDIFEATLDDALPLWAAWTGAASRQAAHMAERAARMNDVSMMAEMKRAQSHIEGLNDTFAAVNKGTDERHAVWAKINEGYKNQQPFVAICSSPVNVAGAINANLWHYKVSQSTDTAHGDWAAKFNPGNVGRGADMDIDDDRADPMVGRPLSVVCMSATIGGGGFKVEAGVGRGADYFAYPTPFTDEFDASAVFIPAVKRGSEDHKTLINRWNKFDVRAHARWVRGRIGSIVAANGGKALVLAARAADGREYVTALRQAGLLVFSQWEAPSVRWAVQQWKDHPGSTLVGTRSLMTGTDAPGTDICTMVYIDRIARSPINALDEARSLGFLSHPDDADDSSAMWRARAKVYVPDATRLLQQAVGRLVRTSGDTGMIVIDDPRLANVRRNPFKSADRDKYLTAVEEFGTVLHDHDEALQWLTTHRERTTTQ